MKTHSQEKLDSATCPFSIDIKDVEWDSVISIVSIDDKKNSVIIELANKERYIVKVPDILYNAIFRSGEENVIEQDAGFDDLN